MANVKKEPTADFVVTHEGVNRDSKPVEVGVVLKLTAKGAKRLAGKVRAAASVEAEKAGANALAAALDDVANLKLELEAVTKERDALKAAAAKVDK